MTDKQSDKLVVPCEVYSRIVGYVRPVAQWNKAKQNEFRDRKTYDVVKELNNMARD